MQTIILKETPDTIPPHVVPAPDQSFCINTSGVYTIPAISATDNVGVTSISFAVTGATVRSSTGTNAVNASGAFAVGTSTITWTVSDAKGNIATSSTIVKINALPVAGITASSNVFTGCSVVTLTGTSSNTPATYKWTSAGGTTVGTSQTFDRNLTDNDGVYNLSVTDANGCVSETAASYTFQKQNLARSYAILGYTTADLGKNSTVTSGSVGMMTSGGIAKFGDNSSVASPGSFVKSPYINRYGSNTNITNPVYSVASVSLPAMINNTTSTQQLSNKDVAQNTTVTLNDNYNYLTVRSGANVVLTGNTFGTIRMEERAQVRFTSTVVNIGQLIIENGTQSDYAYVRFAPNTQVLVSTQVKIGRKAIINPDNYIVTFYMGNQPCDGSRFSVWGSSSKVFANIFMPNGKLATNNDEGNITGGLIGLVGSVLNLLLGYQYSTDSVYMSGLFIVEELSSQNTSWKRYSCSGGNSPNNAALSSMATTREDMRSATGEETLKVTVMPNPSTTFFTLRIQSVSEAPVTIRVTDAAGKTIEVKSGTKANSNVQLGLHYISGTYFAEVMQGIQRKVVQLIKVHR